MRSRPAATALPLLKHHDPRINLMAVIPRSHTRRCRT